MSNLFRKKIALKKIPEAFNASQIMFSNRLLLNASDKNLPFYLCKDKKYMKNKLISIFFVFNIERENKIEDLMLAKLDGIYNDEKEKDNILNLVYNIDITKTEPKLFDKLINSKKYPNINDNYIIDCLINMNQNKLASLEIYDSVYIVNVNRIVDYDLSFLIDIPILNINDEIIIFNVEENTLKKYYVKNHYISFSALSDYNDGTIIYCLNENKDTFLANAYENINIELNENTLEFDVMYDFLGFENRIYSHKLNIIKNNLFNAILKKEIK